MRREEPTALLIGEDARGFSHLVKRLEKLGCNHWFATSSREAHSLLRLLDFDLVLSPVRLRGTSLFALMDYLEGAGSCLFYHQVVEDGCWWLPAICFGERCYGLGALRSNEFGAVLEEVLHQIWSRITARSSTQQSLTANPRASVITLPATKTKNLHPRLDRAEFLELIEGRDIRHKVG
jgi:hypothetical protein